MILTVHHISKAFGVGNSRTIAVNNVSLSLDYGEMLYIVGPSGSGKTTLLSMLSGILRPDVGEITFKDKKIWLLDDDALSDLRLFSIGFVFQDFHLFPKLTSQENVAIPLILQKKSWRDALATADKMLDIVGLSARAQLPPYKLSIGEQQRVAIARAIITQPDLLVFDEPTASLDGDTGKKIIAFIREHILTPQRAVIVITHDNRIYNYATRIVHMEDGNLTQIEGSYDH